MFYLFDKETNELLSVVAMPVTNDDVHCVEYNNNLNTESNVITYSDGNIVSEPPPVVEIAEPDFTLTESQEYFMTALAELTEIVTSQQLEIGQLKSTNQEA